MAKRKKSVRTAVKQRRTSIGGKRTAADFKDEISKLRRELSKARDRKKAVAIENTRLLTDLRQRTDDLSESREQQNAIGDILRVISSSPGDVQPVFASVAEHAARICEAQIVDILTVEDDKLHYAGHFGEFGRILPGQTAPLNRDSVIGRSICDKQPVHVVDLQSMDHEFPLGREYALALGHRTTLAVPLIREDRALGTILIRRTEVRPFEGKHIALLKTFADQASIAIENARLFNEVKAKARELQESLEYQTATADVLNVISRSTTNVQPVFDAIAMSAARLFAPCETTLTTVHNGQLRWGATASLGRPVEAIERVRSIYPLPFDVEKSPSARAVHERRIIQISDVLAPDTPENTRRAGNVGEFRSITFVPLLREGIGIGTIILTHPEAGFKLSPKQLALVQTFADQAVIAIENTRLFDEVQERTKELSRSLDDLRTAQDRLVQTEKLASLGQLTAGIAHEIKNPLNFVNNFSALSAELIDDMKDVLSDISLERNKREELDEITQMLKANLEKVVQHGKRADSIVKNMLLHSREGSGEYRSVDINAIVEESLNLAYHGARAEKAGFEITMQRNFDTATGIADVYPQEITRALLNLISNAFYAATRRATEAGDDFKPVLSAATRSLGDKIEIRIRDNGIGIPAEVREKIFNPFFTTKPSGEGTGLGLSMSHDIIVKQHGGSIDVETEPGLFTEFKIVLPRTSQR
jgi:two-component system, NtrC family, sensor kinase